MQVKFNYSSGSERLSKTVTYEKGDTLLDTAIKNDIPAPYSCMEGICATCEAKVLRGKVDFPDAAGLAAANGKVLTCQTKPQTEETSLEVEYP